MDTTNKNLSFKPTKFIFLIAYLSNMFIGFYIAFVLDLDKTNINFIALNIFTFFVFIISIFYFYTTAKKLNSSKSDE